MIFTQTSPTTLVSKSSGVSALIAGSLLGAAGLIGALAAFAAKADPLAIGFLALLFVIGLVVIATARRQVTTLTNPGTSTIVSTRLIGGKTSTRSFDAAQVAGVQVSSRIEQSANNGSPANPKRHTMLNLYLTDGSKIQLANQIANQNAFTLNGIGANVGLPLEDDGKKVAALFGVQFMSQDASFGDNPVQSIATAAGLMREAMDAAKSGTPYEQPTETSPFARPVNQPAPAQPARPVQPPVTQYPSAQVPSSQPSQDTAPTGIDPYRQ